MIVFCVFQKAEKRKATPASPAKKDDSSPAKRGRGRPKGTTKKSSPAKAKATKGKVKAFLKFCMIKKY